MQAGAGAASVLLVQDPAGNLSLTAWGGYSLTNSNTFLAILLAEPAERLPLASAGGDGRSQPDVADCLACYRTTHRNAWCCSAVRNVLL